MTKCPICNKNLNIINLGKTTILQLCLYKLSNHTFECTIINPINKIGFYIYRSGDFHFHSYSGLEEDYPKSLTKISIGDYTINIDNYIDLNFTDPNNFSNTIYKKYNKLKVFA